MPENPRIVVGLTGRIGSGKTAIAHCLEQNCGFQYLRYSQVLADWFKTDPANKARLQEVGADVMSGVQQRELNRRLISQIGPRQDVVVDGLRHPLDYESLREEFGDEFCLIFIDTPEDIRFQRLSHRFQSRRQFRQADHRLVESHIDDLRSLASVILPGIMPLDQLLDSINGIALQIRERMVA